MLESGEPGTLPRIPPRFFLWQVTPFQLQEIRFAGLQRGVEIHSKYWLWLREEDELSDQVGATKKSCFFSANILLPREYCKALLIESGGTNIEKQQKYCIFCIPRGISGDSLEGHLWLSLEAATWWRPWQWHCCCQCRPLPRPGSTAGWALQAGHAVLGRWGNNTRLVTSSKTAGVSWW